MNNNLNNNKMDNESNVVMSSLSRSVVIELSDLSDTQLSTIGKTLSNLISLSNTLRGSRRITYFKLEIIDLTPIQIIPFLYVKSQLFLNKYFDKLNKLSIFRTNSSSNSSKSKNLVNNFELTLRRLLNDKRLQQMKAIEITFISGRHHLDVVQDICQVFNRLDFNQNDYQSIISMVNIVCIKSDSSQETPVDEKPIICGPSGSANFVRFKIPEEFESLIEIKTIDGNELSIEGFFKVWFHDSNVDYEKIDLSLGNIIQTDFDNQFIIKCDLKEAIIDTNLIPFIKTVKFDSTLDLNDSQTIPPSILTTNNRIVLKMVGLINKDGFCETTVFGIPYVLSPTRCLHLTFTELELNEQRFHALIEVMNEKQVVIILEHKQHNSPINYFALFSSLASKTLIMKSVATKELLLPYFNDSVDKLVSKTPTQPIVESVRKQLDVFKICDIYNPLHVNNNLYDYLSPDGSFNFINN